MDPVTTIVAALVAGLVAGVQSTGEQMVRDSYDALKTVILSKYKRVSIEKLEENPQSKVRQELVAEDLRAAGADRDNDILQLAQSLLLVVENKPNNQHSRTTPPSPEEIVENAARDGGKQAIEQIIERHLSSIMQIRTSHPISNQELLSTGIINNRTVPENVRNDIGQLHTRIREIIQETAARIEERKYQSAEDAINEMRLSLVDRQKAEAIVQADKKIHISYQALRTTVEFFADLNQLIISRIEKSASTQSEANLLFGNAVLVYELTNYVIGYIENFSINGISEINQLHAETNQRITKLRAEQKDLEKDIKTQVIEEAVKLQVLENINARERSLDLLEQEWKNYVDTITSLRTEVGEIRKKIPTLEIIRKDAKLQIDALQVVAMLQILKQNIGTMKATILTLENMKLASLSPNRVRRLLGIG